MEVKLLNEPEERKAFLEGEVQQVMHWGQEAERERAKGMVSLQGEQRLVHSEAVLAWELEALAEMSRGMRPQS
jgi:hypothetical protein